MNEPWSKRNPATTVGLIGACLLALSAILHMSYVEFLPGNGWLGGFNDSEIYSVPAGPAFLMVGSFLLGGLLFIGGLSELSYDEWWRNR